MTAMRYLTEDTGQREPAISPSAIAALRALQPAGEADFLAELVELFLTAAEPNLAALRDAARREDTETIERMAHALKGSCGHFGASRMVALSERLQVAGRGGELADAASMVAELDAEYQRVRAALLAEVAGGTGEHSDR